MLRPSSSSSRLFQLSRIIANCTHSRLPKTTAAVPLLGTKINVQQYHHHQRLTLRVVPQAQDLLFVSYFSSKGAKLAPTLTFKEMEQEIEKPDIVLIDVREREELKTDGKMPNSKNIPLGELKDALNNMNDESFKAKYGFDKPQPGQNIVTHCKMGVRAQNAAQIFESNGYKDIRVYSGIKDWKDNNGKMA